MCGSFGEPSDCLPAVQGANHIAACLPFKTQLLLSGEDITVAQALHVQLIKVGEGGEVLAEAVELALTVDDAVLIHLIVFRQM